MEINVPNYTVNVILEDGAYMPEKAHESDAGFDLKSPCYRVLEAHRSLSIDTGVHMEIPKGYVGFLKSKSGLNVKYGILTEGVIDSGYTGSIVVKMYNHSDMPYEINTGDKITQIVILPIPGIRLNKVEHFEETERGDNGFGSSGR